MVVTLPYPLANGRENSVSFRLRGKTTVLAAPHIVYVH